MPLLQFIGALALASVVLSVVSIAWPKFMTQPRPDALSRVREIAVNTPQGAHLADVLGVWDESSVVPEPLGTFIASSAQVGAQGVVANIQHTARMKLFESLAKQFDSMPPDEKEAFQAFICPRPDSASPSGTTTSETQ